MATKNQKLDKQFPYEVVYTVFGGFEFVGALFEIFLRKKIFKGCPVNFLAKIVARENAVQILTNFPAKRLSI